MCFGVNLDKNFINTARINEKNSKKSGVNINNPTVKTNVSVTTMAVLKFKIFNTYSNCIESEKMASMT